MTAPVALSVVNRPNTASTPFIRHIWCCYRYSVDLLRIISTTNKDTIGNFCKITDSVFGFGLSITWSIYKDKSYSQVHFRDFPIGDNFYFCHLNRIITWNYMMTMPSRRAFSVSSPFAILTTARANSRVVPGPFEVMRRSVITTLSSEYVPPFFSNSSFRNG